MKKSCWRKKGFTLVELVVVIAVLSILATIGVVGGINIARSAADSRNKTAVRNYYTLSRGAMRQLNTGASVYSNGRYTANDNIEMLLRSTTGHKPVRILRLENDQAGDKLRPFASDEEGYYVAFRWADPRKTYPINSSTVLSEDSCEFFVECVYYVQDNTCYGYSRNSTDVEIFH